MQNEDYFNPETDRHFKELISRIFKKQYRDVEDQIEFCLKWYGDCSFVNQIDEHGNTPLSAALLSDNLDIFRSVLCLKPKLDLKYECVIEDKKQNISLLMCAIQLHSEVRDMFKHIDLLLKQPDINVNFAFNDGNTALHLAASKGCVKIVELLMQHKDIKPNIQNYDGETALFLAIKSNESKVAEYLLSQTTITNLSGCYGNLPEAMSDEYMKRFEKILALDHSFKLEGYCAVESAMKSDIDIDHNFQSILKKRYGILESPLLGESYLLVDKTLGGVEE